jgi:hypothetical protein
MTGIAQKIIADPDSFSIDMLTNGVKDGTVPAYIGIPLIQEKTIALKKSQALQAGMQQQGEPPIAQEVLAQAEQATTPVGIPGLQSNLPVATGAAGGIVAFAEGGYADDEEDDDLVEMSDDEKQLFDILRSRMASGDEYEEMAGLDALPAAQAAREVKREISTKVGNEPRHTITEGVKEVSRKGHHPYEDKVLAEAERQGVDPRLALHVLYKETGNLKDPASARSPAGAQGVMQLMPGTARDLGVKDPLDAQQNIEGGVKYLAQLSRMFDDPKLVAAAYNAGPGNVRKYNGVPPFAETRNYVQGLAQGGAVPGYAGGVYVDPMGNPVPGDEPDYSSPIRPGEAISNWMSGMGLASNEELLRRQEEKKKKEAAEAKAKTNRKADSSVYDREDMAAGPAAGAVPAEEPVKEEAAATNPMGDYIGDYAAYLKEQRAENAKNKETNKYLALLQAGLGIMGGTSPYAGANIGQGASQGVAAYLAGRKQESADDRALMSGQLGLTRADLYQKMHLEDIKRKALADKNMQAYRQAELGIKELNAKANQMKATVAGQKLNQEFNLKAEKAWKDSDDYGRVIKDLVSQKKNWDKDPTLLKQFNDARLRYIKNNLSEIQAGGNVASVDELLKD